MSPQRLTRMPTWPAESAPNVLERLWRKTAEKAVRRAERLNSKAQDVTSEAFETPIRTVPSTAEGLSSLLQFFQKHRGIRQILADSQPALETFLDTSQPPHAVRRGSLVSPRTPNASGAGIVLAPFAFSAASALNLKAPERVTSRAPTPKPLPLGYGEAMLTIGPGRIRASFHQSRSFRITIAKRLCGLVDHRSAQDQKK